MVGLFLFKCCIIRVRFILCYCLIYIWKYGVYFGWKVFVEEGKEKVVIWMGKEKYWSLRIWFWCKVRFCVFCIMEYRGIWDCIKEMDSICIVRKDKILLFYESVRNFLGKKYGFVFFEFFWIIIKWRRLFWFWVLW